MTPRRTGLRPRPSPTRTAAVECAETSAMLERGHPGRHTGGMPSSPDGRRGLPLNERHQLVTVAFPMIDQPTPSPATAPFWFSEQDRRECQLTDEPLRGIYVSLSLLPPAPCPILLVRSVFPVRTTPNAIHTLSSLQPQRLRPGLRPQEDSPIWLNDRARQMPSGEGRGLKAKDLPARPALDTPRWRAKCLPSSSTRGRGRCMRTFAQQLDALRVLVAIGFAR